MVRKEKKKMRAWRRLLSIALCLALMLGIFPGTPLTAHAATKALTNGTCGSGVRYSFDKGTKTLTITGRGKIKGYGTEDNDRSPFSGEDTGIETVVISNGITEIGEWAFYDNSTIKSVQLGKDVRTIEHAAFYGCISISQMNLPDGLTTIGDRAIEHCIALKDITLPESVTSVGEYAFDDTGYYRDRNNWEDNALYLGHVLLAGLYNDAYHDERHKGRKEYVSDIYTSYSESKMVSGTYRVKEGTKIIAPCSFKRNWLVEQVIFPSGVTVLGNGAFGSNAALKKVSIPAGVRKIGDGCFDYCKNLKTVTFSKTVMEIGENAFRDCGKLTSIKLPSNLRVIGAGAFQGSGLKSVTIPKNVNAVGDNAFQACASLKSVTLKSGVRSIGEMAFCDCKKLKSVTVPKSVKTIGSYAFGYEGTFANGKMKGFKLKGYKNSAAQKYAKQYGVKFTVIK